MRAQRSKIPPKTFIGIAILVVTAIVMTVVVKGYRRRHPGNTPLLEAQAMDMSVMKAPEGSVPVATEKVRRETIHGTVTYTGTVVALNDEDIYPRVVGHIVSIPVYPGDSVRAGQLVVRLDNQELSARESEALYGRMAAERGKDEASAGVSRASSLRLQAEAEVSASEGMVQEAVSELVAAKAMLDQSRKELEVANSGYLQSQKEVQAMQHEKGAMDAEADAAQADLSDTEADADAMRADLDYWQAEIKRAENLLKAGAISKDEYQRELADFQTAKAKVGQSGARIRKAKAMVQTAESHVHHYHANVEVGEMKVSQMEAGVEKVKAQVEQSRAEVDVAKSKVSQAKARVRSAQAMVSGSQSEVRAASAKSGQMSAMSGQSLSALTAARIVRGYTEIRATADGVVTQRLVSPGVLVSPGTPILRIAQIDRVRLQANVAEKDLSVIKVGNAVTTRSAKDAAAAVHTTVTSIFPAADPSARTALVEALTPNRGHRLIPGQYVTLDIDTGIAENALTVPSSAIVQSDGKTHVWVVPGEDSTAAPSGKTIYTCPMHPEVKSDKPGKCPKCGMTLVPEMGKAKPAGQKEKTTYYCTMHPEVTSDRPGKCPKCGMDLVPRKTSGGRTARRVEVKVGFANGDRTEITEGLQEGDEVIYRGQDNLKEGDTVYPVAWGDAGPAELPPAPAMENMPGMEEKNDRPGRKKNDMESTPRDEKKDSMPGMKM